MKDYTPKETEILQMYKEYIRICEESKYEIKALNWKVYYESVRDEFAKPTRKIKVYVGGKLIEG